MTVVLKEIHQKCTEQSLNLLVFCPFQEIKAKQVESGGTHLSAEDERLLDRHLMEYRHQGHHLPQKEYTILTENWLPKLTNYLGDYKYRQSRATERYRHVIRDPNVVRDFPVDVLKAMATDSTQPTRGPWTVSLHPYIHKQVRVTKKPPQHTQISQRKPGFFCPLYHLEAKEPLPSGVFDRICLEDFPANRR